MLRIDIFNVKTNITNHFQMKKKGFLLDVGVGHVKCKTYPERSFLMSIAQVKMRIPLVNLNNMHKMKTLL